MTMFSMFQKKQTGSLSPHQPATSLFFRYTFGSALFVGWVAGGLALVGGILMCLACRGLIPEESR